MYFLLLLRRLDQCSSNEVLKADTDVAVMTLSGNAFQSVTILLAKKFCAIAICNLCLHGLK